MTRREKEQVVANPLRGAWRQVCGGGTGGHGGRRGWKSNVSWRVRIGANKGVKDILGELAGKSLHRPKKTAEEGNDTAEQFPACNQASLIKVFLSAGEGAVGGRGGGGGRGGSGRRVFILLEQRLTVQKVYR